MNVHFLEKHGWELMSVGLWLDPVTKEAYRTVTAVRIQSERLQSEK